MITFLAILWAFSLANAQTVTLTFTGRDASSQHVQLHRVCVTNLTRGWQETIYWPDTTLSMQNSTGISENGLGEGFSLAQNVPNPFSGETEVIMVTDATGEVFLTVSDVTGKSVAVFSRMLEPGGHHFRIRLAVAQTYILTARQGARSASVKMVNKGTSKGNEILYKGSGNPISYTLKSSTTHPFTFGDQMEYVGYAVINGSEEESQRITQAQGASQTFVMQFQGEQHRLPTVITSAVTEITENSVLCGGTVTDEGSDAVTERGVCWGTSHNPTINDSLTAEGSGIGSFTSSITELESSTTYYVRAYATNDVGTAYGQEIAFTTVDEILPSVTGNITYNQYTCVHIAGSVDYEGSSTVLEKGVCWSTSPNPTIADNYMSFGGGVGSYSCSITDLNPETRYYFSVYARNNAGITCGPVNGGYDGSVTTGYYPTPYFDNISNPTVIDESTMQISFDVTWYPTTYCRDSIVEKGFCWTTSDSHYDQSPSISDNYISLGAGEGSVTYTMTGLTPNVYYHFRPYAITTAGVTFYGSTFFKKIILYTPQVSTASVSDITDISAVCGGNVTGTGTNQFDAVVTARGVCWSTSPNPTIADSHTVDGSGIGVFTSTMTGLSPNTQYYVRAYATNGVGTEYGNGVTFTTASPVSLPTVTTSPVSTITYHAASCGGNVISDGGLPVTSRGVCWSTSHNPTIAENHTTDGTGTGNFISNITGLSASTTYYVRAYAINSVGVAYGEEVIFTTATISQNHSCPGAPTVTDYDGNVYNTVQIGNQCWMKENLRTTHYANGGSIALGSDTSTTTAYRYYPNNHSDNVVAYGYLYNWKAVMRNSSSCNNNPSGVQGICPNGWHVPSYSEWEELSNYVRSQNCYLCNSNALYVAKSLASIMGWNTNTNICAVGNIPSDNDATGFSALSAGGYCYNNNYFNFGQQAAFWSATSSTDFNPNALDIAHVRYLAYHSAEVRRQYYYKYYSFSVRCLRDENLTNTIPTAITHSVSDITANTANCGGSVISDGGATVAGKGVCWSTSPNPTIADSHTVDGSGTGVFTSAMAGLSPNTQYYVRAYATNSVGTGYGNEVMFTTASPIILPSVTTLPVSTITDYAASCGGNVISDGGATVTVRGVCWSTSHNPTIAENHTTDGTGTGNFISNITGLSASTTYYVRAYAINSVGVAYGEEVIFTTATISQNHSCPGAPTVTDYDGNVYNTVQIGNQCWMKENLRTTHYSNGIIIPLGFPGSGSAKYRNYPNDDSTLVNTYGYLYNWHAAMNGSGQSNSNPSGVQGACPAGWHIPSKSEWEQLLEYVQNHPQYWCHNDSNYIAKALASTDGWGVDSSEVILCGPNEQSYNNNTTGFSALPAGFGARNTEASETSFIYSYSAVSYGIRAYYQSSTEYAGVLVQGITLWCCFPNVVFENIFKEQLYSVRCLRD